MSDAIAVTERAAPSPAGRPSSVRIATLAEIVAPILVGLTPIVWLWAANRAEFEPGVMLLPAVVVTLVSLALLGIWRVVAGDLGAASLLTSLTLVAIFAYGTELDIVAALTGRTSARVALAIRIADILLLGVAVVAVVVLARRGHGFSRLARTIGMVAAIVIALAVVQPFGAATTVSLGLDGAGPGLEDGGAAEDDTDGDEPGGGDAGTLAAPADGVGVARSSPALAHDDAAHPDIYYVILDGYARADALARHYDFDNAPFLAALGARGFFVAEESLANYPYTYLSLASSLNGRYLTAEIAAGEPYRDYLARIREATVPAAFRTRGYVYDLVRSVWAGTTGSPLADETFGPDAAFANEFEAAIIEFDDLPWPAAQPNGRRLPPRRLRRARDDRR